VDYEIEFYIPQLTITTIDSGVQILQLQSVGNPTLTAPMSGSVEPVTNQLPANNLTYTFAGLSGSASITVNNLPAGQYLVSFGPSASGFGPTLSDASGVNLKHVITVSPLAVLETPIAQGDTTATGTSPLVTTAATLTQVMLLTNGTYTFNLSMLFTGTSYLNTNFNVFSIISVGNLSPLLEKKKNKFLGDKVIDHGHLVKESEQFVTNNVLKNMMAAFEMRQKEMSKQFERMILRDGSYADTPEWIGHDPDPPEDTYLSDFAGSYKCAKREHGDLPTAAEADEIEERPFSAHLVPGPERVKHILRYRYRPAQLAGANVKPSN